MVFERGPSSPGDDGHEVIVVQPGSPETQGVRFDFTTHREPIYHGEYDIRRKRAMRAGSPNMHTSWQTFKNQTAREELRSGRSIVNVKYFGRPDELLSAEPGMRLVAGDMGAQFVEDIDGIDDEYAGRSPEGPNTYKRKYPHAQIDEDDPSDSMRAIGVFSPIDGRDKFSEKIKNCIALIGFGEESRKYDDPTHVLSLLAHINPEYLLDEEYVDAYEAALRAAVHELGDRSFGGSARFILGAGQVLNAAQATLYWRAMQKIGRIIQEETGTLPQIMVPPNTNQDSYEQHAYVRTQEARVRLSLPAQRDQEKWREPLVMTFAELENEIAGGIPERYWWTNDFGSRG